MHPLVGQALVIISVKINLKIKVGWYIMYSRYRGSQAGTKFKFTFVSVIFDWDGSEFLGSFYGTHVRF